MFSLILGLGMEVVRFVVPEDFMATFREIDMSIHSLLDKVPEQVKVTAEDILQKYKDGEGDSETGRTGAQERGRDGRKGRWG